MEKQNHDFITIDQIGRKIKRHKWTLVTCVAVSMIVAFGYNRMATPIYSAPAIVSFEQFSKDDVLNLGFASAQFESNFIANRVKELKTWTFAQDVFQALPDSFRQLFLLPDTKLPNSGTRQNVKKVKSFVRRLLGFANSRPENFDPDRYVIRQIQKGISVGQAEKTSSVLSIAFDSENAELAREVTNTVVDVLKRRNLMERRKEFSGLKEFIDRQIKVVEQELHTAEDALQNFKGSHNIASLGDESREILTRITQVEVLYNQVLADTKARQKKLSVIQQKIDEHKKNISSSVPETSNPMIAKLREDLIRLEVESASLQVQGYAEDHPRRRQLSANIEMVKQNLVKLTVEMIQDRNLKGMIDPLSSLKNYLEESVALEIEIQALLVQQKHLQETLDSYNQRLKSLSENDARLFGLMRDREVSNKTYVNLLEEREQARLREAAEIGTIRVIEQARTPLAPYEPRKKLNVIIGLFAGSLIGLSLIFLRDSFNDALSGEEEIETMLDLPVLASIQKINSKWTVPLNGDFMASDHFVHIYLDAFTYLWNCLQASDKGKFQSVMITSACPGEGKSTIAVNLAITAAKLGRQVLLIDGDLRKPSLAKLLNVPDSPGLADIVVPETKIPLNGNLTIKGLSFLSAGSLRKEIGLVWASPELKRTLPTLMREFDFVVMDAPPVLGIPDVVSIGSFVEGTVLCIASDQADKTLVLRARKLLEKTNIKVIGVVWNKVRPTDIYGKYYGKYAYRKYYQT